VENKFAYKLESCIRRDRFFFFSLLSYGATAAIFVNTAILGSTALGLLSTLAYLLINAVFLGTAFFAKEDGFFRLTLGILLLIMLLGFIGWIMIVLYTFNAVTLTMALVIVTTISSVLKRTVGSKGDRYPA